MYISKIELKNVKGFRDLSFDLDRGKGEFAGWTVFTGDNGSGKSTLLKAIAVCLTGTDNARALQTSFYKWLSADEIHGYVELGIVRTVEDDYFVAKGRQAKKFPARVTFLDFGDEVALNDPGSDFREANTTPSRTIWSKSSSGWFSCGYGPFRRVFGASPEATRQMVSASTERYVTMFQEAASLFEVDRWLKDLRFRNLAGQTAEGEQLSILLEILRDELLPNGFTVDRVDPDGLILKDRDGVELAWSEMSDGYRSALALLADILRHLIGTFGIEDLTGRDASGKLFVKRSGVVLIDEIDSHLHPAWQRDIGFWLTRHFPKIQFLVTTHSPLICQAAFQKGLFVLPSPGSDEAPRQLTDEEYQTVITSRPDTILLSSLFGLQNTRSEPVVEARAEYAELEAKLAAGGTLTAAEKAAMDNLYPLAINDEEL